VTDEGVVHFQPSLQHGLRERAAGVKIYAESATRQDFWVDRLKERHVNRAVETKIEFFVAAQMRRSVRSEVGPTTCQMKAFDR